MQKISKIQVALFLVCIFTATGFQCVQAAPAKYRTAPDPVTVMADGVIVRPLGIVSTIIGSVFYVVSLPFTLPSDSEAKARQQLIEYPAWFTFKRPIGEFGRRYERPAIIKSPKKAKEYTQSRSSNPGGDQ